MMVQVSVGFSLVFVGVGLIALVQLVTRQPARSLEHDSWYPESTLDAAVRWLGRGCRRVARQPSDPDLDRRWGRRAVAIGVSLGIQPLFGLVVALGVSVAPIVQRRRSSQLRSERIAEGLAEVFDLFAIALHSGHNVATATHQVARWSSGEFAEAFGWCVAQADQGRVLGDALEELPARLDEPIRPLIAALVANERYGVAVVDRLAVLASDVRRDRQRRAEAAARRLPVVLLFPLVICVLPAFLLLTVVPIVVPAMRGLV